MHSACQRNCFWWITRTWLSPLPRLSNPLFLVELLSMLLSPLICFLPLPRSSHLKLFPPRESWESPGSEDSRWFRRTFPIPKPQNLRCPHTTWPHRRCSEETVPSTSYIAWFYLTGCVPAYPQENQSHHTEPSSEDHHW